MKKWLLLFLLTGLAACVSSTVFKDFDLKLIEKDKPAGEVKMGADFEAGIEPIFNQEKAFASVLEQCKDWQYEGAILLNGYDLTCKDGAEQDCKMFHMIYTYQCLSKEEIEKYQEGSFDPRTKQNKLTTNK